MARSLLASTHTESRVPEPNRRSKILHGSDTSKSKSAAAYSSASDTPWLRRAKTEQRSLSITHRIRALALVAQAAPRPRRWCGFALTACIVLGLVAAPVTLRGQRKFDEREIKATFLFNFAQFVEWPVTSFADPQAPLVIGLLGDDPFDAVLDAVVRGEVIKNRRLVVTRFRSIEEVDSCHILFVSPSEAPRYRQISEALQGHAILTVGDTDGFATSGGMIRFVTENNHVRLRINLGGARAVGLTVNSRLLKAAEVVGEGEIR
jgi:hypothetical protein